MGDNHQNLADASKVNRFTDIIFLSLAAGLTLFHLYTGTFGLLENYLQMSVHITFILLLVFLTGFQKAGDNRLEKWMSLFWIGSTLLCMGYIFTNYDYLTVERYPFLNEFNPIQIVLGWLFLATILEAGRRTVGVILPGLCLLVVLYAYFGIYAPGILKHSGKTIDTILDVAYLSTTGTFGLPLYVSASYLVLFVIFGAVLKESGLGDFLMDMAKAIGGKTPGGPAKIAVFASAGMGTISGSPVANVMTTGTLTIPLMIKTGYKPHTAGAIEAVASTGGMITPPVMGILAFLMSEFSGIPYITICKNALLPAILYYFGVYVYVHFEARKLGLKGLTKDDIPDWKKTIKNGVHLATPILVLMYLLMERYSPMYAIVYSIYACIIVSFFRSSTRLNLRKVINIFREGAKASLMVGVACALAGFIGGIINFTGLAIKLSDSIVNIVGGSALLLLFLTAFVTVLMGTGLPSTVCYIVLLPLVIPALKAIGFSEVSSHFFVVFWATLSFITPPVGLAFYAACAISNASVMRTGVSCLRVGAVAFIIPFLFVYFPSLLLIGSIPNVLLTFVSAVVGVFYLSVGLTGYWLTNFSFLQRLMSIGGALLLLKPGILTDMGGVLVIGTLFIWQYRKRRMLRPA
jgi:TRAP transporter 4TM/12TM fusion protein